MIKRESVADQNIASAFTESADRFVTKKEKVRKGRKRKKIEKENGEKKPRMKKSKIYPDGYINDDEALIEEEIRATREKVLGKPKSTETAVESFIVHEIPSPEIITEKNEPAEEKTITEAVETVEPNTIPLAETTPIDHNTNSSPIVKIEDAELTKLKEAFKEKGINVDSEALEAAADKLKNGRQKEPPLIEYKPAKKETGVPMESISISRDEKRAEFVFIDEEKGTKRRIVLENIPIQRYNNDVIIAEAEKRFKAGEGEVIKPPKEESTIFGRIKGLIQQALETKETEAEKTGVDPGRIEQLYAKKNEVKTKLELGEISETEANELYSRINEAIDNLTQEKHGEEVTKEAVTEKEKVGSPAQGEKYSEEGARDTEAKPTTTATSEKEKTPTQEELTQDAYDKYSVAFVAREKYQNAFNEALNYNGSMENRPYSKEELKQMKQDAVNKEREARIAYDKLDAPPPFAYFNHYAKTGEIPTKEIVEHARPETNTTQNEGATTATKALEPEVVSPKEATQVTDTFKKEKTPPAVDDKTTLEDAEAKATEESKATKGDAEQPTQPKHFQTEIEHAGTKIAEQEQVRLGNLVALSKLESLYEEEKATGVAIDELTEREEQIKEAKQEIEKIEDSIEAERTKPLEEARAAYAKANKEYVKESKTHYKKYGKKGVLGNITGAFAKKEVAGEKEASLQRTKEAYRAQEQAKQSYEQSKLSYGQDLFDAKKAELEHSGLKGLKGEGLEKALKEYKATELFDKLIVNEHDLLQKAKIEAWPPKKQSAFTKALDWYNKQNRLTKITISTAIITGGITGWTAVAAGGLTSGMVTAASAKLGTSLSSAFFGVGMGGAVDITTGWSKGIKKEKAEDLAKARKAFAEKEVSQEAISQAETKNQQALEKERKAERKKTLVKSAISMGTGFGTSYIVTNYGESLTKATNEFLAKSPQAEKFITGLKETAAEAKEAIGKSLEVAGDFYGKAAQDIKTATGETVGQIKEAIAPFIPKLSGDETIKAIIGGTGPEGAIIPELKKEGVAKAFGWNGKSDLTKWAETKAHNLWREDMREALAKPKTREMMQKLGYSPSKEGYTKMMSRIGKGTVELDPTTGKIDLVNTEFLKARAVDTEYLRQTAEATAGKGAPALEPLPKIEKVDLSGSKVQVQEKLKEAMGIKHTDTFTPKDSFARQPTALNVEQGPESFVQKQIEASGLAPKATPVTGAHVATTETTLAMAPKKEAFMDNLMYQGGNDKAYRLDRTVNMYKEGKISAKDIADYASQKGVDGNIPPLREIEKNLNLVAKKGLAETKAGRIDVINARNEIKEVLEKLHPEAVKAQTATTVDTAKTFGQALKTTSANTITASEKLTSVTDALSPKTEKVIFNIVHQGGLESGTETRLSKIANLLGKGKISPEDIGKYYAEKTGTNLHPGYLEGQIDIVRKIPADHLKKITAAIASNSNKALKAFDIKQVAAVKRLKFVLNALYNK